jgi:hypothetical protein
LSPDGVMNSVEDAVSDEAASGGRHADINRRTPVFIVCSPRPRVGKTLVARLLTEFFVFNAQPVAAFDASPSPDSLSHFLPDCTVAAAIGDTKSQMALFDQLIINDTRPKVIDLAAELFDPFFALMRDIGFAQEAPKQLVSPVVLFVADQHQLCIKAYEMIWRRFPGIILVPVHNQAAMSSWDSDSFPTRRANGALLRISRAPWTSSAVVNRSGFSFTRFLESPASFSSELHQWINRSFVALRELQLCILMEDLRPLFYAKQGAAIRRLRGDLER